jgi:hypothetical protein
MTDRPPSSASIEDVAARARRATDIAAEETDPARRAALELEAAKLHKQLRMMQQRSKRLMLRR